MIEDETPFSVQNDVTQYVYASGERAYAPHCDPKVLHAPGVCEFCDHYPDWQKLRAGMGMDFSPTDLPWPGNRPEGYAGIYDNLTDEQIQFLTVGQQMPDGSKCYICGDPEDHKGVPHGLATGDNKTRFDVENPQNASVDEEVTYYNPLPTKIHPYFVHDVGWKFGLSFYRESKEIQHRPREWHIGVDFGVWSLGIAKQIII